MTDYPSLTRDNATPLLLVTFELASSRLAHYIATPSTGDSLVDLDSGSTSRWQIRMRTASLIK